MRLLLKSDNCTTHRHYLLIIIRTNKESPEGLSVKHELDQLQKQNPNQREEFFLTAQDY